jgi:hypothetical protein
VPVPGELTPPGLWVPVRGPVHVLLPYVPGRRSANVDWIKDALGPGRQVRGPLQGTWAVARSSAEAILDAMVARFGAGNVTLVNDVATQIKCGRACQQGNPDNALQCRCQCGGTNHGGVSGDWALRGEYAIDTIYIRRVFSV